MRQPMAPVTSCDERSLLEMAQLILIPEMILAPSAQTESRMSHESLRLCSTDRSPPYSMIYNATPHERQVFYPRQFAVRVRLVRSSLNSNRSLTHDTTT